MKTFIEASIFILKKIEKIIFPPCCLICGKQTKNIWCRKCKKRLENQAVYTAAGAADHLHLRPGGGHRQGHGSPGLRQEKAAELVCRA